MPFTEQDKILSKVAQGFPRREGEDWDAFINRRRAAIAAELEAAQKQQQESGQVAPLTPPSRRSIAEPASQPTKTDTLTTPIAVVASVSLPKAPTDVRKRPNYRFTPKQKKPTLVQ